METEMLIIAQRYSLERFKIYTPNFDLDYKRNKQGEFILVSEKAVIRTLGKVTKVPIGVNEEFHTFEEAEKATKKYWSEYYKKIRATRTDKQRIAEARRQKRYREKRKAETEIIDRRQ